MDILCTQKGCNRGVIPGREMACPARVDARAKPLKNHILTDVFYKNI